MRHADARRSRLGVWCEPHPAQVIRHRLPRLTMRSLLLWCFPLLALLAHPATCADFVSAASGRLTVETVDHELSTPLGPLPVKRLYRDAAQPASRGWTLDITLRIDVVDEQRVLVMRGNAPIAALESRDGKAFEGDGGWQGQRDGTQWRVRWPNATLSLGDGSGREVSRTDANGNAMAFVYDGAGRLARAIALADRGLTFGYSDKGLLAEIRDAAGRRVLYRHDATGNLVEVISTDERRTTYGYTPDGRLNSIVEPTGETIAFRYDDSGRVVARTSSNSAALSFVYGAATRITRSDGYWLETRYDADQLPLSSVDSLGNRQGWSWNAQRQLVGASFSDGSVIANDYDGAGRVVTQRTSRGRSLAFGYDGAGLRPRILDSNGAVTRFGYDGRGNLIEATTPAGRTTRFAYDAQGRRIAATDGAGRTTRFEYDVAGNLVRQTNPDGGIAAWEYDVAGRLVRERDAAENAWIYRYTPQGWLTSVTTPGGYPLAYAYDPAGRVVTETVGSRVVRYRYNAAGRLAAIESDDGSRLAFAFDALGNLARVTDELGRITAIESDALGRPVQRFHRVPASRGPTPQTVRWNRSASAKPVGPSLPILPRTPHGSSIPLESQRGLCVTHSVASPPSRCRAAGRSAGITTSTA
jgi:YD repeat-containing protein